VLGALLLQPSFGAPAVATSIAVGAWCSAGVLIARGAATFGFSLDLQARRRLPLIVLAALLMGGLLWLKASFVLSRTADAHALTQAAVLGVLIAGGLFIYALLLTLFGVIDWAGLRRRHA
jgi:putative peptidoglycan lipid II flippase